MKIQPRTKESKDSRQFPYVLFSAPPSGSADYPAEVSLSRMRCTGVTASQTEAAVSDSLRARAGCT